MRVTWDHVWSTRKGKLHVQNKPRPQEKKSESQRLSMVISLKTRCAMQHNILEALPLLFCPQNTWHPFQLTCPYRLMLASQLSYIYPCLLCQQQHLLSGIWPIKVDYRSFGTTFHPRYFMFWEANKSNRLGNSLEWCDVTALLSKKNVSRKKQINLCL